MPKRNTEPFRRLTGLEEDQSEVPFVIPDLEQDLRGGMYLTMALAKLSSRSVVKKMYSAACNYFALLNEFLNRAREGDSEALRQARRIAAFPEAREIGMGYSRQGWDGSAIGPGKLNLHIVETLIDFPGIAEECVDEPDTITFIANVGLDRASDALASINKRHLGNFTEQMAQDYLDADCVETVSIAGAWNSEDLVFDTFEAAVPVDGTKPILLVPKEIVRSSPPVRPVHYEREYYPTSELGKGEVKETIMEENKTDPTRLKKVVDEVLANPDRYRPRREFRD